jgi:uncharacterized membrane protein HdeD (DUF308 family)
MGILEKQMANLLSRRWWVLLLRGLIAIAYSVLLWLQPALSIAVLVLFFGAYALVDGILEIWLAIAGRKEYEDWWTFLLPGIISSIVGILTFIIPGITALMLLFYIAIWAVTTGILEIEAAIRLRKEIKGEWLLFLGGLISLAFGIFIVARPLEGALAVLWNIETYALIFGIILVILAFKTRSFGKQLERV